MAETRSLRPYQQQARDAIHTEWESGRLRTLLVLPTGTGKTCAFGIPMLEYVQLNEPQPMTMRAKPCVLPLQPPMNLQCVMIPF